MTTELAQKALQGLTAILVDDDQNIRTLLSDVMTSLGINVVAVGENGQEAIALFEQHQPDLVCLDIHMPILSGLEALEILRKQDAQTIVVMISAATTGDNVRSAIAKGANGVIAKPFTPMAVASSLEKAMLRASKKVVA